MRYCTLDAIWIRYWTPYWHYMIQLRYNWITSGLILLSVIEGTWFFGQFGETDFYLLVVVFDGVIGTWAWVIQFLGDESAFLAYFHTRWSFSRFEDRLILAWAWHFQWRLGFGFGGYADLWWWVKVYFVIWSIGIGSWVIVVGIFASIFFVELSKFVLILYNF
jgi:hypothetical protein